jgi:[ribosomal protein S5]-alanine N-acetyltransferase
VRILTTPRLVLRPLDIADAPSVQARFPRWEVVRYLDAIVPWPYPPDGALVFIGDHCVPAMQRGEAWHWSLRPRCMADQLIGSISLRLKPDDNRGFWLDPAWQGQGLMTEACTAVNDFWFGELGQPILRVVKATANLRSRRVSERSGMRLVETMQRDLVSGRQHAELWELSRDEWRPQPRGFSAGANSP